MTSGCAGDPQTASPVSLEVGTLQGLLKQLSRAYEKKSRDDFLSALNPASELRRFFEKQLEQDFAHFSEVDLSMFIERVEVQEKQVLMTVRWKGSWKVGPGSTRKQRGKSLFLWSPRKDPKLLEILGRSPFVTPSE